MCSKNYKKLTCQYCGNTYYHWNGRSKYCPGPHYTVCEVCGKRFQFDISKGKVPACCSKQCTRRKTENTNLKRYGTKVASKNKDVRRKLSTSAVASMDRRDRTCLEKYGVTNVMQSPDIRRKVSETLKSRDCRSKYTQTSLEKYGTEHPMQNKGVFDKHAKAFKCVADDGTILDSSYELLVYNFLIRNNIKFETQVPLEYKDSNGKLHTTFVDFCIDGILFEVKGGHLISGVFDYQGVPIADKLEVYRRNHIVVITDTNIFGKPNTDKSNGLKYLDKCPSPLIGVDIDLFSHSPKFPYKEDRPKQFYDVKVAGQKSSKEAFFDETIRWNMIRNRIMYSGGFIDSNQILTALNVTRICKQPSWFSKSFAKTLISSYLTSDVVVDPFAGWGARYDACLELGKLYIGYDLNKDLVNWHQSRGRDIQLRDAKEVKYDKSCSVFICPPYQSTEVYFEGQDTNLTQCQWLQIVMNNVPNANEYLMVCKVVDPGWEKYIVDTKVNKSHFGTNKEYVILIHGNEVRNLILTNEDLAAIRDRYNRRISTAYRAKDSDWIWVTNELTHETKAVLIDEEDNLKDSGWVRGRGRSERLSNSVWVTDGTRNRRISKTADIPEGWSKGRTCLTTAGRKYVNKAGRVRAVKPEEVEKYVTNGWELGGSKRVRWVYNPQLKRNKRVASEELESCLEHGWMPGYRKF